MTIKHQLRKLLWKVGYDLTRFDVASHSLARRKLLFRSLAIDTVLDVGANAGQYARQLRGDLGYQGRILSFEPLESAFALLERQIARDAKWKAFKLALGESNADSEINVAGNSVSSSLLDMLPPHERSAPESRYVSRQAVQVRTLDSMYDDICAPTDNVYLKIDTQGFERKVLKGAERSLGRIRAVQMEMSLVPLYAGETLIDQLCALMDRYGFNLVGIEEGFVDTKTGHLLQVDGVFQRR